jgi:hypothetical protein
MVSTLSGRRRFRSPTAPRYRKPANDFPPFAISPGELGVYQKRGLRRESIGVGRRTRSRVWQVTVLHHIPFTNSLRRDNHSP